MRPGRPEVFVGEAVVDQVREAGGLPVLLPPCDGPVAHVVRWILDHADGVVITGGAFDIHPEHYGQQVASRLDRTDEGRTAFELLLATACMRADRPLLGLCGGMQALAVAAGGTLYQDILSQIPGASEHEQQTDPAESWHEVHLDHPVLVDAFGGTRTWTNSTHHQAVHAPGQLVVAGWAPDGVIEAVLHPDRTFCVGVQWHPEILPGDDGSAVFRSLLAAVRAVPR